MRLCVGRHCQEKDKIMKFKYIIILCIINVNGQCILNPVLSQRQSETEKTNYTHNTVREEVSQV